MNRSEGIAELAKAVAKAQSEIKGASKDSENPHLQKKYADLASVWEACREPLTKNGLSVVQSTRMEGSIVVIETMLLHASGEYIIGEIALPPTKADPQGHGSAITYARRYALAAMVGVAPEDDDGAGASGDKARGGVQPINKPTGSPPPVRTTPPPTTPKPAAAGITAEAYAANVKSGIAAAVTEAQLNQYLAAQKAGLDRLATANMTLRDEVEQAAIYKRLELDPFKEGQP